MRPTRAHRPAPATARSWSFAYVNIAMTSCIWGFLVICPIFRSLSLLVLLLVPLRPAVAKRLHMISRYASYYYAYEVMCVAVPIIAITVNHRRYPPHCLLTPPHCLLEGACCIDLVARIRAS